MPFILAILGAIAAGYIWYLRTRTAASVAQDLAGAASDVLNAARRFGFRRRANVHPVESIDDPNLAIAALGSAFLELDDLPTAEQRAALLRALQSHTYQDLSGAEESLILGRWLVGECNGAEPAVTRLARRLAKLDRKGAFEPAMAVLRDVAAAGSGTLSRRQKEALDEIARAFGVT